MRAHKSTRADQKRLSKAFKANQERISEESESIMKRFWENAPIESQISKRNAFVENFSKLFKQSVYEALRKAKTAANINNSKFLSSKVKFRNDGNLKNQVLKSFRF